MVVTYEPIVRRSIETYKRWSLVPAPKRGEFIKAFGDKLAERKEDLAKLITQESFKTITESLGEVQEAIDMCYFACGLSRQLYGLTMPSERPNHRMQEMWHPLGPVAVISAFNFPVAVWAWNFCLAAVCGNTVIWKPSPITPRAANYCQNLWHEVAGTEWAGVSEIIHDNKWAAKALATDRRIPLVSGTGSTAMGRELAPLVAARFGRGLWELGGNNAAIISNKANLDLAAEACTFAATGTTGQRCTTLRRAFVHQGVWPTFITKMVENYKKLVIGDPMDSNTQVGPLISEEMKRKMGKAITQARNEGAIQVLNEKIYDGSYVSPVIIIMHEQTSCILHEVFAPILYVMPYKTLSEAITMQNAANEGLSSCIFTDSMQEVEQFIGHHGSDCGIVNVNIATSGAEIGGAFGGEKDTGGGRESGSDAWKNYMRRTTITINSGDKLTLAQGIHYDRTI